MKMNGNVNLMGRGMRPLTSPGNCNHRTRQTEGCFRRHAKSSLFGVAFDQPGSNSEAF
jgi:hypothetical protein